MVAAVHPERVSGVITLGIPFMLPGPSSVRNQQLPQGFYITRWQVIQILIFDTNMKHSHLLDSIFPTFLFPQAL